MWWIAHKADINCQNAGSKNATPLHVAVQNQDVHCVVYLLQNGADIYQPVRTTEMVVLALLSLTADVLSCAGHRGAHTLRFGDPVAGSCDRATVPRGATRRILSGWSLKLSSSLLLL